MNAGQCAMCVVMAAGKAVKVDHTSVDMDAILTTLNIRSMFGDNMEDRIRSIGGKQPEQEIVLAFINTGSEAVDAT